MIRTIWSPENPGRFKHPADAAHVRWVFDRFIEIGLGTELAGEPAARGVTTSRGFRIDTSRQTVESSVCKALARVFRLKRMLNSGELNTIAELAAKEGLAVSYMTRMLRLTLLAPDR